MQPFGHADAGAAGAIENAGAAVAATVAAAMPAVMNCLRSTVRAFGLVRGLNQFRDQV